MSSERKYWLLKAEPDSRIVKGKDVKFSVDDFESVETSPWEGVRNYEARNLLKEMGIGEKALFYHSNCKNPGIAGFAEVLREAFPDYTAWDPSHPYFDPKANKDNPKWFMVELNFTSRARHFVPLALLRYIAESTTLPSEVDYIGDAGARAIKGMDLVTRGRLSVQRVEEAAWGVILLLAERGGWDNLELKSKKGKTRAIFKKSTTRTKTSTVPSRRKSKATREELDEETADEEDSVSRRTDLESKSMSPSSGGRKRKADDLGEEVALRPRRSSRGKR